MKAKIIFKINDKQENQGPTPFSYKFPLQYRSNTATKVS